MAYPTTPAYSKCTDSIVPPVQKIFTSASGKEVRVTYQPSPRYRYVLKYDWLPDADKATLIAFVNSVQFNGTTFSFTPPAGGSVTCRLDLDSFDVDEVCSGLWNNCEIALITVL